jgi:hypothetical protein
MFSMNEQCCKNVKMTKCLQVNDNLYEIEETGLL